MPAASHKRRPRRDTLNIRVKPEERGLIDRAADLAGKTRTDFILEAARRAATDTLLDQTLFAVDAKTFDRFAAALDAPPHPSEALHKTMTSPAPWDRPKSR